MTGSAIIDLPTLFIGILALLVMWDVARTVLALVLQAVSMFLMCRYYWRNR